MAATAKSRIATDDISRRTSRLLRVAMKRSMTSLNAGIPFSTISQSAQQRGVGNRAFAENFAYALTTADDRRRFAARENAAVDAEIRLRAESGKGLRQPVRIRSARPVGRSGNDRPAETRGQRASDRMRAHAKRNLSGAIRCAAGDSPFRTQDQRERPGPEFF